MELLSQISLTIASSFFLIILLISYITKKKEKKKLRSSIYGYLLLLDFLLATLEITVASLFYKLGGTTISYAFLRLRYLLDLFYFTLIYYYYLCYFENLKYKNMLELLSKSKKAVIYAIFSVICCVIYWFLPFKEMTQETYSFVPGPAYYFIMIFSFVTITVILINAILEKKKTTHRNRYGVLFLTIIMVAVIIFQAYNSHVAILGFAGILHLFNLYFIAENPDLEYIEEIGELTKEVEKASKTKSDFLSNMSHEIRTPMNAIVGFSETILNDSTYDQDRVLNDIKHIESSGRNLVEIINNILDISKIESGTETLEEKEYSLANIIMELSSIIEARIDNKPIKLEINIDETVASKLYGDSTKLFQILLNILTNSVKYTEVGKISLELTHQSDGVYEHLKFKVSDTGFGIKKEDYDKLFEKFSRLDIATANEIEGTGLGLVITKQYVDILGGKIYFDSEYGVGTTFYVEIPQRITDKSPLGDYREVKQKHKISDAIDCSSYRALVVDDNKLNLKVAKRLLGMYKFQIDTATSGRECVYKFKEGTHYDIMFLDHMMPEMDGIEILHIIKHLEGYHTPIMVVLTANAITGVKEMYLREGFDEYLSKPIDLSELNRLINKYFGKNEIFTYKAGQDNIEQEKEGI